MNQLGHTGNLIEDAKYYPGQNDKPSRATFTMAVKRPFSKDSDLYNYIAWNTAADIIGKGLEEGRYLKGCAVEVAGYTTFSAYTERETGKQRKMLQIVVQQCFSRFHENQGYEQEDYPGEQVDGYDDPYNSQDGYASENAPYYENTPAYPSQNARGNYQSAPQTGYSGQGNRQAAAPRNRNGQRQNAYVSRPNGQAAQGSAVHGGNPGQRATRQGRPAMANRGNAAGSQAHYGTGAAQTGGYIPASKRGN